MARDALKRIVGESEAEFRSRLIRYKQNERDKDAPLITPEAANQGDYRREFVTDVDQNTKAWTLVNRLPTVVERWFQAGYAGFEEPARNAINRCIFLWNVRKQIGNLSASYKECSGGDGAHATDYGMAQAMDYSYELDEFKSWFHPAHWAVFENVVRWGHPAGSAGNKMERNPAQAIASARAVVGTVANTIAYRKGY